MRVDAQAQLTNDAVIAVVIPAYKVRKHIGQLLLNMPSYVDKIFVVDDACPEATGRHVAETTGDPRVAVLYNAVNLGVGGAVMAGMSAALAEGADIIVKVDGDGQMSPALIGKFVEPILAGDADYTKGNRFYSIENVSGMPAVRVLGNGILSFMAKLSTGYWDIFDPTNGFTAIHAKVAAMLPLGKISRRYFFETDLLFRLGTVRAVVMDIPMQAVYGEEVSNLKIKKIFGEFLYKHARNFFKRISYNYFIRDMSAGTVELIAGCVLSMFSLCFGLYHWHEAVYSGKPAASGTIMLAALPLILGTQMLLGFLNIDISSVPRRPLWPSLARRSSSGLRG